MYQEPIEEAEDNIADVLVDIFLCENRSLNVLAKQYVQLKRDSFATGHEQGYLGN